MEQLDRDRTNIGKLQARIAELEAENERWKDWHSRFTDDYRELRLLRADKAEAHAADCKRLVTACENDLDAERMKRREVEAALQAADGRIWKAEAALAKLTQRNDELRSTLKAYLATIKRLEAKVADREASKAEAEANYSDVVAGHENELALRLEAEATLAEEKNKTKRQMFALRATDVALANANELIDALDPHGLRRKKMGLRARAEEGGE